MGSAYNTGMQIEDIVHKQIEELALKRKLASMLTQLFAYFQSMAMGYVLSMLKVFKH